MFDLELTIQGTTLAAALLTLVLTITRRTEKSALKTTTNTGTYCGHCGSPVPSDPIRVVALADKNYFVYRCKACKNETLLPTQPFP